MANIMSYAEEQAEWTSIGNELIATRGSVTAYDVSHEQRQRMKARGQRPLTFSEILTSVESMLSS